MWLALKTGRRDGAMAYFCYIHRTGRAVPHFEVLPELTELDARDRAAQLMAQRPDAERAEVWDGDTLVITVPGLALADQASG